MVEEEERSRPIQKKFFVDQEEVRDIKKKMAEAKLKNFSNFARLMLTNGKVEVINFEELTQLRQEIKRIGVNINQVAKIANTEEAVTSDQLAQLIRQLTSVESLVEALITKEEQAARGEQDGIY